MLPKMTLLVIGIMVPSCILVDRGYPQERKTPKSVSLCDVFAGAFPSVDGVVSMRGVLYGVLRDERCPEMVELQGEKWPRSIDVISTREGLGGEWRVPGDLTLSEFVQRYPVAPYDFTKRVAIEAVFIGELRYKDSYARQPAKGGGMAPAIAFGRFGKVPVQMEVYAVRDIKVLGKKQ